MRHHTTFRQMEIFEAIARLGSFTRASEELHLTQPTVSMQMKKLSDIVGIPLIEHVGKKIQLTETGRDLVQTCRDVFAAMDSFTMSVSERQGLKKGLLSLMAVTTASYIAPRLLGEFSHLYPGIDVSLHVTNREHVLANLEERLSDLYILGQPPVDIDVVAMPFMANPLVVLAAPNHPLAGQQNIPLARLAEEPWLLREAGSGTRAAVERLFAEEGLEIRPRMALGSTEAIKQAILAGLGISVMSIHSLTLNAPDQFAVLKAKGFPILRQWYAVYPAGRKMSSVARTFLDFLHSKGKDQVPCQIC
jgi:LysR family transcriptional regulator, low CO2-responsive transcriptional regulator